MPKELPVLLIKLRHHNQLDEIKDFKINITNIHVWLVHLKEFHAAYQDVVCDYTRLTQMAENDDMFGNYSIVDEVYHFVYKDDNEQTTSEDINKIHSLILENEMNNGPEQGGATSRPLRENEVDHSDTHVYLSADRVSTENSAELIRTVLRNQLGRTNSTIDFNIPNTFISDYNTPSIQSRAFLVLFPYGEGDVTRKSRRHEVSFTQASTHYLNYAIFNNETKMYDFPVASHARWMHWSHNTAERHRFNGQRQVYLKRNSSVFNMSENQLADIVRRNGIEYLQLVRGMQVFNANIVGSNSYYYKRRRELEALMECHGMPTAWFTLSAADNHWKDLQRIMYDVYNIRNTPIRYSFIGRKY